MAECPISLEKAVNPNPSGPYWEAWRIAPIPFNADGKCTVKITVDGSPPIPITFASSAKGIYGNFRVGGGGLQNGLIVLDPPIPKSGTIIWDVTCPDCKKQLRHDFASLAPPAKPATVGDVVKGVVQTIALPISLPLYFLFAMLFGFIIDPQRFRQIRDWWDKYIFPRWLTGK